MVRTRIAPTPSGNLHLGTAHTALFNYLFARHNKGKFILRIDDTDKTRYKKEFEEDIIRSLKWLGFEWDEGPDIGGPYGPYRQSERMDHYWPYAEKLLKEGKAYYCYCSSEELQKEKEQLEKEHKPIKYSGKCRNLSQKQIDEYKKQDRQPAVRLVVPEKKVSFIDPTRGEISVNSADFGDFIIVRGDKSALLMLASTVDDIEMKITHTIRGEDYLNFVPRQIMLFEALGVKPPVFAHLPFVYGQDGSKLSKRHGAVSVTEYREMGYLPEAVFNYLILLGWSSKDNREIIDKEEIVKLFALEAVNTNPHRFNITKFEWINGEYIRKLTISNLQLLISNFYENKLQEDIVKQTIPLVQERIKKISDYLPLCEFLFKEPDEYEFDLNSKKELFKKIEKKLQEIEEWKGTIIGEAMQNLAQQLGIKNSEFFMILRVAISGKKITQPLNESMELLGKEECLKRINKLI